MTRVGTWNLEGKWSQKHEELLQELDCDVLLLTEVRRDTAPHGYHSHLTGADMASNRAWAGIYSRARMVVLDDPHPASASATVDGREYCSSILPWRGTGRRRPWVGDDHAARTAATVSALHGHLGRETIWGGDFNHAMVGKEWSGSKAGRGHIEGLLRALHLRVPTAHLAHRIEGLLSIDHIAVPTGSVVRSACRVDATGLSDHDAYVVTLD